MSFCHHLPIPTSRTARVHYDSDELSGVAAEAEPFQKRPPANHPTASPA